MFEFSLPVKRSNKIETESRKQFLSSLCWLRRRRRASSRWLARKGKFNSHFGTRSTPRRYLRLLCSRARCSQVQPCRIHRRSTRLTRRNQPRCRTRSKSLRVRNAEQRAFQIREEPTEESNVATANHTEANAYRWASYPPRAIVSRGWRRSAAAGVCGAASATGTAGYTARTS